MIHSPPTPQLEFHGVYNQGNPTRQPQNTADSCTDFRIMPGFWLRTRAGRKIRYNNPDSGGLYLQFHEFRSPLQPGNPDHFRQYFDGSTVAWQYFLLTGMAPLPSGFNIAISGTYDSNFAQTNPVAVCNLRDRSLLYNGLGVRLSSGATNSQPPFVTYDGAHYRYFGMDAYCPGAKPSVAFNAAGGAPNTLGAGQSVRIYVGLYNQITGHYSNAVLAGTITNSTGSAVVGNIVVSSLGNLSIADIQTGEVVYCFYATIQGGFVPYLVMDNTLLAPFTSSSSSATLPNITVDPNNLNLTLQVPTDNFPPRPMRSIWVSNSRVYGILLANTSGARGGGPDFTYANPNRYLSGIVFSKTADDLAAKQNPGIPEECWPLLNFTPCPSAETPVAGCDIQEGRKSLVLTPTSAFTVYEALDGLHEWDAISRIHGIRVPATLVQTQYGRMWVNQRNQIVILPKDEERIYVVSRAYQYLLNGKTMRCADYRYDPINELEVYQVWFTDGTCVIHDFAHSPEGAPAWTGEGYAYTNSDFTAAKTLIDASGIVWHVAAKRHIWTEEGQPEDGLCVTTDEDNAGTKTEINGVYVRNWEHWGDPDQRKLLWEAKLIADGATSAQLGASPLILDFWADFEQTSGGNAKLFTLVAATQAPTASTYIAKPPTAFRFWFKIRIKLNGHSTDDATFAKHTLPYLQGDLAKNFYGSIVQAYWQENSRTPGIGVDRAS